MWFYLYRLGGGIEFNLLKKIKLKFPNGLFHEDNSFGIKLFAQARKIAIINKSVYNYRWNPTGITKGKPSMENIPLYLSHLKPYFSNGSELKFYSWNQNFLIVAKEIIDFIQNMPDLELKSLMKECFYKHYLERLFIALSRIQKDPLQIYKQALIYTGDNPQNYVIKTFEEASDEEKFRWFQKVINDLQTEKNILNSKLNNHIKTLEFGTAIHNHLAYKLGNAIIENSKSLFGYIRMFYVLSYIRDKHLKEQKLYEEKIKANPNLALPPLESYKDYKEALKEKECFTYKLGSAFIKASKSWYKGGMIKFYFEAKRLEREFKKNKNK